MLSLFFLLAIAAALTGTLLFILQMKTATRFSASPSKGVSKATASTPPKKTIAKRSKVNFGSIMKKLNSNYESWRDAGKPKGKGKTGAIDWTLPQWAPTRAVLIKLADQYRMFPPLKSLFVEEFHSEMLRARAPLPPNIKNGRASDAIVVKWTRELTWGQFDTGTLPGCWIMGRGWVAGSKLPKGVQKWFGLKKNLPSDDVLDIIEANDTHMDADFFARNPEDYERAPYTMPASVAKYLNLAKHLV